MFTSDNSSSNKANTDYVARWSEISSPNHQNDSKPEESKVLNLESFREVRDSKNQYIDYLSRLELSDLFGEVKFYIGSILQSETLDSKKVQRGQSLLDELEQRHSDILDGQILY